MILTSEVMRVKARTMLIGKVRCGNLLSLFSAVLRFAVWSLGLLLILKFNMMSACVTGKAFLCAGVFAVVSGAFLLCCARTVKDKWYSSILAEKYRNVENIIVSFSLRDLADSVILSLVSIAYSFVRIAGFFAFPASFAVATYRIVTDGVSRNVLAVLLLGNVLVFGCAVFFCGISLNCISLSRSVCVGNVKAFRCALKKIEFCSLKIWGFDIFLSVANRSSRRLAKIMYVYNICKENTVRPT